MSVTATYDFDWHEHYRASREVMKRVPTRWISSAFAGIAVVLIVLNVRSSWGAPLPTVIANVLPWVLLGFFWVALIPMSQWWAAKRVATLDPSVSGQQERTIDSTGYHSRGNGVAIDLPWHTFLRCVETTEFLLFFYNKRWAYYIPKRALSSLQLAEARELVRASLGHRARLNT